MSMVTLEKRRPAENVMRFYRITVTPTLFGAWAVVREWGRIGRDGQVRALWFDSEGEARMAGEGTAGLSGATGQLEKPFPSSKMKTAGSGCERNERSGMQSFGEAQGSRRTRRSGP